MGFKGEYIAENEMRSEDGRNESVDRVSSITTVKHGMQQVLKRTRKFRKLTRAYK